MAPMVPLPAGLFWVYLTGVILILGSVGIMTQIMGTWSAWAIALLMLAFIVFIHAPGLGDPATRTMHLQSILRNVAFGGGALTWAGIFASRERRDLVETAPPLETRLETREEAGFTM